MSGALREPRVVYKKAYTRRLDFNFDVVLTLLLPKGTLVRKDIDRCHEEGLGIGLDVRKNRASRALVVGAMRVRDRTSGLVCPVPAAFTEFVSSHDRSFVYRVGKLAVPHEFSKNNNICAPGIHFFKSLDDAIRYL